MENKSRVWTLRAAAILLILVLATVVWSSGLFARFVSFASGGDSARVAKFDFKVSNIMHQDEKGNLADVTDYLASSGGHNIYVDPGVRESASHFWYEYTVENDSEVTVEVTFKAKTTRNIPYRVYFAGSRNFTEIQKEYAASRNDKDFNIYRVNYGDLVVGGKDYSGNKTITLAPGKSQTVYLWMDWANVDNNPEYDYLKTYDRSYEIDQFTVTIDCRQVD